MNVLPLVFILQSRAIRQRGMTFLRIVIPSVFFLSMIFSENRWIML